MKCFLRFAFVFALALFASGASAQGVQIVEFRSNGGAPIVEHVHSGTGAKQFQLLTGAGSHWGFRFENVPANHTVSVTYTRPFIGLVTSTSGVHTPQSSAPTVPDFTVSLNDQNNNPVIDDNGNGIPDGDEPPDNGNGGNGSGSDPDDPVIPEIPDPDIETGIECLDDFLDQLQDIPLIVEFKDSIESIDLEHAALTFDIEMGSTSYAINWSLKPDTSTILGTALEAFRFLIKSLGYLGFTWIFLKRIIKHLENW